MTQLKEIRIAKQLTQQEAARRLGVSLRSYITYENELDATSMTFWKDTNQTQYGIQINFNGIYKINKSGQILKTYMTFD